MSARRKSEKETNNSGYHVYVDRDNLGKVFGTRSFAHSKHTHQLRRAASIKEKLDALSRELRNLLDGASSNGTASSKRTMSAAARRKIAAAQKARWAKRKRSASKSPE
jgi:hypothetical protein